MKLLALFAVAAGPLLATAAPFHKRQATTTAIIIPTSTSAPPPPPPSSTTTTTTTTGTASPSPTQTVAPFPSNVAQLSAWQALESNPDLTNFTSLIRTYSPGLVANLNDTTPAPPPPPASSPPPSSTVSAQQDASTTVIAPPSTTIVASPTDTAAPSPTPSSAPPPPAATQWTVFAPTNLAMQPLLNSSFFRFVEALASTRLNGGQPGNDSVFAPVLQRFLDYHIVQGVVLSTDFPPAGQNVTLLTKAGLNVTAQRAPTRPVLQPLVPPVQLGSPTPSATLEPSQATSTTAPAPAPTETLWVSNAQVLVPDVLVANGVIHVVDRPLSPLGAGEAAPPVVVPTSVAVTSLPTVTLPTTVPSITATVPIPTGIATLVPPA